MRIAFGNTPLNVQPVRQYVDQAMNHHKQVASIAQQSGGTVTQQDLATIVAETTMAARQNTYAIRQLTDTLETFAQRFDPGRL